jgi:hypothetical protein
MIETPRSLKSYQIVSQWLNISSGKGVQDGAADGPSDGDKATSAFDIGIGAPKLLLGD